MLHNIERHGMLAPGLSVGVAVSGGADSLCLLHLLHELAPRWNLRLAVIHIDHGLRGDASRADARFVAQTAARLGLNFHLREADLAMRSENLEQAARRVRQDFFAELIGGGTVSRIATGHTRSDQAETVLYRILRGSGLTGLRGILPVTAEHLIRPLLSVSRCDVEAWLTERGLEWREDATNRNRDFARNRLRHDILPLLAESFNPRLEETLAHLAELALDEESYWDGIVPPAAKPSEIVCLAVRDLVDSPPAVARRRVRRAIETVKGDLSQIGFAHVEAVLEMAASPQGSGRSQLPGLDIFRSFQWIRIAPAGYDNACVRDFSFPVPIPGFVQLPRTAGRVDFEIISRAGNGESHDKVKDEVDWQSLACGGAVPALELRNWRPGDQYRRTGQSHGQKLKDLFQDARVPLWERRHWPVLVLGGRIVWSRQFGPAAECAANPNSECVLCIGFE